jgi:hypothetical protein
MALFESILDPQFKANLSPDLKWAFAYSSTSAERYLSDNYFNNAVSAHKAGEEPAYWVRKLRKLASSDVASSGDDSVYKMNNAALLLGMYLRQYGTTEKSTWKACFRDSILQAIDVLGDEDPMNDQVHMGCLPPSFSPQVIDQTQLQLRR